MNRRRRESTTVSIIGLLCLAAAGAAIAADEPPSGKSSAKPAEITIALAGFADRGPSVELAPLRIALDEMLTGDLSQYVGLRVVERLRTADVLKETDLGESGLVDRSKAQHAGQALAAEFLLSGTFAATQDKITVHATIFDVKRSTTLGKWTHSSSPDDVAGLEQSILRDALDALGLKNAARQPLPSPKAGDSPLVAVLGFRNVGTTVRLQSMEGGFSEILQSHLSVLPNVRLVERARLHDVLAEQKLSLSALSDPRTAVRVGRLLGAERLIVGFFAEFGKNLRIDVRIIDTQTAAIVRAETATAASDQFATMLEGMALNLSAALAIKPPDNATKLLKGMETIQSLEAARHFADATSAYRHGNFQLAADEMARCVLLEPDSHDVQRWRLKTLKATGDYQEAILAGKAAISRPFRTDRPEELHPRADIYFELLSACAWAGDYRQKAQIAERGMKEFANTEYEKYMRFELAYSKFRSGKRDEGLAVFDSLLKDPAIKKNPEKYDEILYSYYSFLGSETMRYGVTRRGSARKRPSPERIAECRALAKRVVELYELLLTEAKGKRHPPWPEAAKGLIMGPNAWSVDEDGNRKAYLPDAETARLVRLALSTFDWAPTILVHGYNQLADMEKRLGHYQEALDAYRYVANHREDPSSWTVPPVSDTHVFGTTWSRRLEAQCQVARIEERQLKKPNQAKKDYETFVREFGLGNSRGYSAATGLARVGGKLTITDPTVLIWGGGDATRDAYVPLLEPMGYRVHSQRNNEITLAEMMPYPLVVLARGGGLPYTPAEVVAIRSYVATGGSLLCVVTPGWNRAGSGIHNSLLEPFGVRADDQLHVRWQASRIAEHPITRGIETAFAKCAVDLAGPPNSAVLSDSKICCLRALPYRAGRIVVTSYGQFTCPGDEWTKQKKSFLNFYGMIGNVNINDLPLAYQGGLQHPLLKNVLAWLLEPFQKEKPQDPTRRAFQEALADVLRYEHQTLPYEVMMKSMNRLVDEAPAGTWKEEALWAAAEASQSKQFFSPGDASDIGFPLRAMCSLNAKDVPPGSLAWHERLIRDFPDSPLHALARFRLADLWRLPSGKPGYYPIWNHAEDRSEAIRLLNKVEAPSGTYLWAWREFRLGQATALSRDDPTAIAHFRAITERMPECPEKTFSQLNLAVCLTASNREDEAQKLLRSMPRSGPIWRSTYPANDAWLAFHLSREFSNSDSVGQIAEMLKE